VRGAGSSASTKEREQGAIAISKRVAILGIDLNVADGRAVPGYSEPFRFIALIEPLIGGFPKWVSCCQTQPRELASTHLD
jgi:hypothetical protein